MTAGLKRVLRLTLFVLRPSVKTSDQLEVGDGSDDGEGDVEGDGAGEGEVTASVRETARLMASRGGYAGVGNRHCVRVADGGKVLQTIDRLRPGWFALHAQGTRWPDAVLSHRFVGGGLRPA